MEPTEIARLAAAVGFNQDQAPDLTLAVAVALAESGGNPAARGDLGLCDSTWGPSVGLWQIRSLHSQRGTGGVRDERANLDPITNARSAWEVFRAAGYRWTPWSVYNSGSYTRYLDVAAAAAATVTGVPAPTTHAVQPVTVTPWTPNNVTWSSTVSGIAEHYGHGGDWQSTWNLPQNASLRILRGTPEQIQPGDTVYVIRK